MNSSLYLENLEAKYTGMLRDDPSSNCFVLLAEVLIKRKKTDDALKVLVNGLRHNKHNITARFLLGKIYFERWLIDSAKKEFEKVIKLAPDNIAVSKILIQIYHSEENEEAVSQIAKKLSFYHPDNEEIKDLINNLGQAGSDKFRMNRTEGIGSDKPESQVYLTESSDIDEAAIETVTLADLYFAQGNYEKALSILNKLLESDPENVELIQKIEEIKKEEINLNTV